MADNNLDSKTTAGELLAAIFDTSEFKQFSHDAREEVADLLAGQDFDRILDLDCGTGLLLEQLFEKCPNIEARGFDYRLEDLSKAKERLRGKNVSFDFGQAINLPYPDNSFDIFVSTTTFHHYKQPHKVMSEVRRVLKPNGMFIICDTYLSSMLRYLNMISKPVNDVTDMALYSKKKIWQMLNAAGFTGIQWRLLNKYAYLVRAHAAEMPLIEEF